MIEHYNNIVVVYFKIKSTKLYTPVVTLSINNNIKFLERLKQGFKRTISWNKHRYEKRAQPKNNNQDYMIDPTSRNINGLFFQLLKNGENDPTRNSLLKYYMLLVKIKDFNGNQRF